MTLENNKLEKVVVEKISAKNMYNHIKYMTENMPNRIAGGGQDLLAAKYIKNQMESYGLDVELDEFETFNSYPGEGRLSITSPEGKMIECTACLHIEGTPPGGYEAELVYVGAGGVEDYEGKDVKGKIVLAEVSYSPATPEKARLAHIFGASGIVLMNWGLSSEPLIPMRALKAVWGNPTPETWNDIPKLYAVTTTRADGEYLKDLCLKEKVTVNIFTTSDRRWGKVTQPIATLKSDNPKANPDEYIIVSGHLDAWTPGVTDNTSGNAVMLEIARVLSEYRSSLQRNIVFCFWNGHEIAEAAGSTYYVDSKWSEINRGAVAYFNIDSPGMIDTSYLLINRSPELSEFHGPIEERVLGEQGRHFDLSRIGDQSFFGIGVPSITGRFTHSDEAIEKWNGATFGWWNHTNEDDYEKLDIDKLEEESRLWVAYTMNLAIMPILPHRFKPKSESILRKITETITQDSELFSHLSILNTLGEQLVEQAEWIDNYAKDLEFRYMNSELVNEKEKEKLNRTILKLSRYLTYIITTVTGRYNQDSYGHSDLYVAIPLLADLKKYDSNTTEKAEKRVLFTKILRARNQICDGIYQAIDEIDNLKNFKTTKINVG